MIGLGILLLIIALIAWLLGAQGMAGFTMDIAKWVIIVGVILAVAFLIFGGTHYHGSITSW
jgi:uncharacterized membrane protein YtjA (UPF0391 family)